VTRLLKHLFAPPWIVYRAFPRAALRRMEAAIRDSERSHSGELRFAVEAGLHLTALLRGVTARRRARQVFAELGVWDTEHNSGVLIYVQLVDRGVEIVADRGIGARVAQPEWDAACRRMEKAFREGRFQEGALAGIGQITALLRQHFPAHGRNPNELTDKPAVL
jgi:TPM domain